MITQLPICLTASRNKDPCHSNASPRKTYYAGWRTSIHTKASDNTWYMIILEQCVSFSGYFWPGVSATDAAESARNSFWLYLDLQNVVVTLSWLILDEVGLVRTCILCVMYKTMCHFANSTSFGTEIVNWKTNKKLRTGIEWKSSWNQIMFVCGVPENLGIWD